MKSAGATSYLVNGLGQRVKKSTASVDTFFVYDEAGHLIGEYDSTAAPIQETLWLGDLPVAVIKPKTGGFDVFYIWTDNLGTPRQITDTTNVSRWEWANNDPFGNNTPNENPSGVGAFNYNLRFPGQYYDVETGTNYNYFRDYDAAIGRYVESDPIGINGGLNSYGYVAQRPLGSSDIDGLKVRGSWRGVSFGSPGVAYGGTSLIPPDPDWFGYINVIEISVILSGQVVADVDCVGDCGTRWSVRATVPVTHRGTVKLGPNAFGTLIGLRAGLFGALGANAVLGAARGAWGMDQLRRKWGAAAALAMVELINRGPDALCLMPPTP